MSTKYPDLFAALAAPFGASEVKARTETSKKTGVTITMSYVTARVVMNRLDSVLGPENWWERYVPLEHSVVCELTIRLPDGSTVTKSDAGGYAGMSDAGDDDKSGFSDAMKRAAVKFGVGRYLYRDGVPVYAKEVAGGWAVPVTDAAPKTNGHSNGHVKERRTWPTAATGADPDARLTRQRDRSAPPREGQPRARYDFPQTGRHLFAWIQEQERAGATNLLRHMNAWGNENGLPRRIVDWAGEQIVAARKEAAEFCERLEAEPVTAN